MRYARFLHAGRTAWGVVDIAGKTVTEIEGSPFDPAGRAVRPGPGRALTDVRLLAPCVPSKIFALAHNYRDHLQGREPPREPQVLLPALLKHHGYETAISGKLHFIPSNHDYAFDHFWSFAAEGPGKLPTWPATVDAKHGRGAARRVTERPFPDDALGRDLGKLGYPKEDAQTFWITDRALEFLDRRDRSIDRTNSPGRLAAQFRATGRVPRLM